jgi:predicted amidophosphoribosyltransferase
VINTTDKLLKTNKELIFLDELWFCDFAFGSNGKTQLGSLRYKAKHEESISSAQKLIDLIKTDIQNLSINIKNDYFCFVPSRKVRSFQLTTLLRESLLSYLNGDELVINKNAVSTPIKEQRDCKTAIQRWTNISSTYSIDKSNHAVTNTSMTILLIDDFYGSGATMNTIASLIKTIFINSKVIGIAITGSPI